jgi:hypothetical protein
MMTDQKTNDDKTMNGEQPQYCLAQMMGAAMLAPLDHHQTLAVRAMLGTRELRDFFRTLSALAETIQERADKLRAANGKDKSGLPESAPLPPDADDRRLREWLERTPPEPTQH